MKCLRLTTAWLLMTLFVIWNLTQETKAIEGEAMIIKTGVKGKVGSSIDWDVSPDGKLILFNTNKLADGLLLLEVKTQKVSSIPGDPGRFWEMAAWSPDGSQVVAISTAIRNNRYQVGQQEVILIDPRTWRHRKLAATPGVNIFPFFSGDGKTVYYFKGEPRDSGATPASRFDLYAYDLASDQETRLTYEEIYQVGQGHDDGKTIMFSAYGIRRMPSINPIWGRQQQQTGIYVFVKALRQIRHLAVDQGEGFFNLYFGGRDAKGNIYFKAAKQPPGGGRFIWFIYRCNPEGRACTMLIPTSIDSEVSIAAKTDEIFVSTVQDDGEIVFRRFAQAR
jgi:hypothetical protein